jgi:hypothetical protein
MARELSEEELEALIARELWWQRPENQAQLIIEEAQVEQALKEADEMVNEMLKELEE